MKDYQLNNNPRSNNGSISKKTIAYVGFVVFGMGLGVGGTYALTNPQLLSSIAENPIVKANNSNPINQSAIAAMPAPSNFVVDVVKETGPAVVRINSERKVETEAPEMPNDSFFRDFFGSQVPSFPHGQSQIQRGTGSGFIVSDNGQILTNAHVVAGADEVTVTLKDGRTLKGRVLGSDPTTDVAVVKIEADHLPVVKVGKSNQFQVGEWAIAIGNPLGLDNTVTTGIISATGRSSSQIGVGDKRVEFIQTDAAINPGNSGGPLLNAQGEVIGINTAIRADAMGIGFAIPINQAKSLQALLASGKKVPHPYIGVQMVNLTPDLARQNNRDTNSLFMIAEVEGILVVRVMPDSPAERAGIRRGDVIVAVNNQPIQDGSKLQSLVDRAGLNQVLKLKIQRSDRSLELTVQTAQMSNAA
jgi:Do/DeqQ family serine protease